MGETESHTDAPKWLVCRVGSGLCALPLGCVGETMRMLPVTPLSDAAGLMGASLASIFLLGVAIVRGVPLPVVDPGALFGEPPTPRRQLVTINIGTRHVGLGVDEVLGVSEIGDSLLRELPPLLRSAATDLVRTIGSLDGEFLALLEASRLVPDAVFDALDAALPTA